MKKVSWVGGSVVRWVRRVMAAWLVVPAVCVAQSRDTAAAKIRAAYFRLDYALGMEEALRFEAMGKATPATVAWRIANQVRVAPNGTREAADSLARRSSGDRWAQFARAITMADQSSDSVARAVTVARGYLRGAPRDADARWLYGFTLLQDTQYTTLIHFVDSLQRAKAGVTAELLVLKGNALASRWSESRSDSALRRQAASVYEAARRLDPGNVGAYFYPATSLILEARDTAAYRLIGRAAELAPTSPPVHERYWWALLAQSSISLDERRVRVAQDAESIVERRNGAPSALRVAASAYQLVKRPEREAEYLNRIVKDFPDSPEAESVIHNHIRELSDSIYRKQVPDTVEARDRHRQLIEAFLSRPHYYNQLWLGNVLVQRMDYIVNDTMVRGDALRRFVERFVAEDKAHPNTTHVLAPLLLLDRSGDIEYAARLISAGDTLRAAYLKLLRPVYLKVYRTVGEYANAIDGDKATTLDVHGWLAFRRGNIAEAKKLIGEAQELARRNPSIRYHLGQIAELEGDTTGARLQYVRGFANETGITGYRSREALARMFRRQRGSAEGFDQYLVQLKEEERADRQLRIVADRMTDNVTMLPFDLARYDGNGARMKRENTSGKITVVNFWGTWCGPCVLEAPQLQQFADSMSKDPDVLVLTVDYRDDPETLRDFMITRKFRFPVLLDEKHWVVDTAQITAFPTTWFFDKNGKLVYKKIGGSEDLLQEFVWRIGALKAGKGP